MTTEAAIVSRGFVHLLFSQVSSRVLTFILNILAVRQLPPEVYGIAVVQFHLITTSILTFSREGVRRACLRGVKLGSSHQEYDLDSILPLSWLCVPQGLLWSIVICAFVLALPGSRDDPSYVAGVGLHGIAAFIEVLSEPPYILSTCLLVFKLQLVVETLATVAKCATVLLLLNSSHGIQPLVVFGLSQVVYGSCLCVGYWAYFLTRLRKFELLNWEHVMMRRVRDVKPAMLSAFSSFTLQAIEKHFLGEAEKFIMAIFQPNYDQGVYGLVNNLGSLVVRTVFQPFEQAVFTAFSMSDSDKGGKRGMQRKADLLTMILKMVLVMGTYAVVFGPFYSFSVLWIAYGKRWAVSEAPHILAIYCVYVCCMALNGVSEAFVHATANKEALKDVNLWLVIFSVMHSAISIFLVNKYSTSGLVVAGCLSMCLRVLYCANYTRSYFALCTFSVIQAAPSRWFLLTGCVSAAFLSMSERRLLRDREEATTRDVMCHVGVGVAIGCLSLGILYLTEKKSIVRFYKELAKRSD